MARSWQVLLVTSVGVFMTFLDVTIVNIAFPDIQESFPASSLPQLSWILNVYAIVFAAALVPAGRLADRLGRRRFFFGGLFLFLGASAVCGAAGSVDVLIGARAVQALGGAMLVPASLALVLPEFPLERRATATALWGATGAVAAAAGPSLGGLLVEWQGWRAVFYVNLVIGIPVLLPARRLLRESREPQSALPDVLGAVLFAGGVGALVLGIIEGPDWGWSSGRVVAAFALSALLLAVVFWRSSRHRAPVIELSLFLVRSFAVANAGVFVFALGFYALLLCNVLFLTGVWGYSILEAGIALTPGPIAAAVAAPIGGRLSDRFGQRLVAVPGGWSSAPAVFFSRSAWERNRRTSTTSCRRRCSRVPASVSASPPSVAPRSPSFRARCMRPVARSTAVSARSAPQSGSQLDRRPGDSVSERPHVRLPARLGADGRHRRACRAAGNRPRARSSALRRPGGPRRKRRRT